MRISTAHLFDQNLTAMLQQQKELGDTQLQLASGKKILKPSDDPVSAIAALNLQREHNLAEQYLANADKAENKLSVQEGTLSSVTDILHRVKELAIQGLNDTYSKADRKAIAGEITQLNEQLLSLANSRDSSGDYLFSGFSTDTQPYTSIGASYAGDDGQRNIQLGSGVVVATNEPGNAIFEAEHRQISITDNLGSSSAQLNITQMGSSSVMSSPITISFAAASNTLTVTQGAITETISPYAAGESINLSQLNAALPALTLQLDGVLADGDSYTLDTQVTTSQTLFKTINDFAMGLLRDEVGPNDPPNHGDFLTNITYATNKVIDAHAKLGTRINVIEQQRDINSKLALNMEKTLSAIQDLDYSEAISKLALQTTGLQAAQQSFSQVQSLSLFDYL